MMLRVLVKYNPNQESSGREWNGQLDEQPNGLCAAHVESADYRSAHDTLLLVRLVDKMDR